VIIVVEGASAAGKTTWCRGMPSEQVLFEGEPPTSPSPLGASDRLPSDPLAIAEFSANDNARRWSKAREISERCGWVVCDTDPFKLHFSWTLWVLRPGSDPFTSVASATKDATSKRWLTYGRPRRPLTSGHANALLSPRL
jgi:hypothetical protein